MKKAIAVLISFVIVLSASSFAYADSAVGINADYSLDNADVMVISGVEDNLPAGTEITVTVFYEGKNYGNLSYGSPGQIAAVLTAYTDADGKWSTDFIPSDSAYYDIYAGSDYREYAVKIHIYAMKDRKNVIDTIINSDKASVERIFADSSTLIGIIADTSKTEKISDTSYIGTVVFGIREELSDKTQILKYFDLACAMAELNSVKTSESLDKTLAELEKMSVSVNNIDVYNENATDDIKAAIAKRMADNVKSGTENFSRTFTDALILGGIEASNSWTDIDPFMKLLNNEKYSSDVYNVSVAIVKKSFESIEELNEAINSVGTGGSNPGTGGSGGSGGGGGGSTGGIFGSVTDTKQDNTNNSGNDPAGGERLLMRDVSESHWAFDSIHYLYWKNIISGDEKGYFNPDNKITRAEMIKILCEAFDIAQVSKDCFGDVSSSDWYYGYAAAAYAAGLAQGYDGNLNPEDYITRQDMAVLVYRFALYKGMKFDGTSLAFNDSSSIADYAAEAVGSLCGRGIINGTGGGIFAPNSNSTRAEAAAMIYRLIKE